jgi:hypothetical protein
VNADPTSSGRALRAAGVALLAGLVAAVAAPLAAAQVPAGDSATGVTFTSGIGLNFEARSGPTGENPSGTVGINLGGGSGPFYSAQVVCLAVTGNRALIGWVGTQRVAGMIIPAAGLIGVVDAGPDPDPLEPGPDMAGFLEIFPYPPSPPDCSAAGPLPDLFPVLGDMVVVDAQPFPTDVAQCREDGWTQFGFRSRRRCIRFVRLIPGLPPYPSTTRQCRHGGWAQFGFRNQGPCLRFVRLLPEP